MRDLRAILCFFLLAAFSAISAFSQAVSATLVGTVTDASGAVVANAKVTLTESNTGVAHTVLANESGNYSFVNIPPGNYRVVAEMVGFKKELKDNIDVVVDSTVRVDMKLSPGNLTETVEVTAAAPELKADRADVTTNISTVAVEDLPLSVNRNYQNLLTLVPGTTDPTYQHSQFFNAASSIQMNTNGQFRMANNYQIEGIDDNERSGLLQILIPPAEAIQQVDVSTSNHDVELGRATGAVTNVMLKSGTNKFHGGAYEFLQNNDFDARLFFNPSLGHIAYNQVGGNLGGPIKKNKVFFFGDYLRTMDYEATNSLLTIPSAPFRSGNLSSAANGGFTEDTVYDPATGDPVTGANRTPFPGNIIPASRINPVSAAVLNILPPTNQPITGASQANDYSAQEPNSKVTDHMDSKVDYQYDEKDRFSVRFSFERPVVYQAPYFGNYGGDEQFAGQGEQRTFSSGINWDRVISPSLITQVRVGLAYYNNIATETDYGIDDSTKIGIPGVNLDEYTSGMASIAVGDFSPLTGYSASLPWARAETNIDLVNTWTKIHGNHSIKWGVDFRRVRDALLQDQTYGARGVFSFSADIASLCTISSPGGLCTYSTNGIANDMADFLLDQPSSVGRDVNTYFPALRDSELFVFAGDRWNITPKWTLDLGLRWELYTPFKPQFRGGFSNYDPANNTLVIAGVGGNPDNMGLETHYRDFAPRIGTAYRLTRSTVLRFGLGLSYTPFPDDSYAYNFPVSSNNEYLAPGGTYQNNFPVVYPNGQVGTWAAGIPAPQPVVVPSNGIITNPSNTSNYKYIPTTYKNPYVIQWNIAVQQTLAHHFVLDVAYVASHGVDTVLEYNENAGFVIGAGANGQPEYPTFGRQVPTEEFFDGFSSSFNALEAKVERRFFHGFYMTNSFTWQKAMSYNSDDGGPNDWYINFQRNYGRSSYDRTLNLVSSYSYQLPVGQGQRFLAHNLAGTILGGWQITGVVTARTGQPITFTGQGALINATGNTETPNLIAPLQILHGINTGNPWFSTSSFAEPATGTWGSLGYGVASGPGEFRLDGSIFRNIQFKEGRYRLQLRAEAFNLTNTPIFSNPNTSLTSTGFGYITSTVSSGVGVQGWNTTGRSLELGVKIYF